MDLYHTNPYKTGTVECDKCGKDIDVSKGFYHGSIYKVDSHIECINEESKEDYNVRQTCMYLPSDDLTLQPWEQEVHFFNP